MLKKGPQTERICSWALGCALFSAELTAIFFHVAFFYMFVKDSSDPILAFDIPPLFISMQIVIFPVHRLASSWAILVDMAFMRLSSVKP
jgi:hypothetical protein